jgi:Flp pilus assembly protein TadG
MKSLSTFKNTVSRFAADRSGNFALAFAAASTMIMMASGIAIDFSHALTVKSNLSQALDAALLSTAREVSRKKLTSVQAQAKVEEFLQQNLNTQRVDPTATHLASFKLDTANNSISATVATTYKMAFPVFHTASMQTIEVASAAAYAERSVEVSMVLDVTGSMAGGKLSELKSSAKAAVAEFIDNGSGNTKVAIVPYSFGVNTGALKSYVNDLSGKPITGNACSTERRGAQMFTDASPAIAKATRADTINFFNGSKNETHAVACPSTPLMPLTKNSSALNAMIDTLQAAGGTAGQIGLQWGWYMLSQNWSGALPPVSEPVAYGTPNVDKYLILMTDGLYNSEASGLSSGAVATYPGISMLSGRLAMTYCDAIKSKKIKLFTIGFRLKDIGNVTQQKEATRMLTDCATTPAPGETTFFDAQNGAQLTAAFKEIAKRVERVSLIN